MAKNRFLKKFISLFLAVGMIFCMMPVLAFSEANAELTISDKEISAGGSGDVTVDISANSQVSLIQFVVRYDKTKLQLNSVTEGTVAKSPTINSDIAGEVYFVWDDTAALTAGGTLMTLNFSPKAGFTEGSSNVVFGQEQEDEFQFGTIGNDSKYVSTPVTKENGVITIAAQTPATETYTVAYDANGGTGAPGTQTKTKGTALKLSSTVPTKTDCTFKYWQATDGTTYAPGANYTKDEGTTLSAVWEAKVDEDAPLISVSKVKGKPGDEVEVSLNVKNNPGFMVLSVTLQYDSSKLELIGDPVGIAEFGGNWTFGEDYLWDNNSDTTYNGDILLCKFKIKNELEDGFSEIIVTFNEATNGNENSVFFETLSGGVEICNKVSGDVTGDGIVNTVDLVRLRKYLAKVPGTEINFINADVTNDGSVNTVDLVRFRKYLAKVPGTVLD